MLKKIIVLVFFVPVFLLFNIKTMPECYAISSPHIVIDGEIWLLDSDTGGRVFLLPNSYYAKIDNMDNDYYYITFNGVGGKVEKNIVSTVGYPSQAAGTMQELKIDSQFSDFKTISLRSSMDASSTEILLPVEASFIFLGEYPQSEMWYCIRYNENIGYIKASRTTVPEMEIPAFVPETEDTVSTGEVINNTTEKNPLKDADNLRILIIVGISIPALFLIFLLFRPNKGKRQKYYYEE